MAQSLSGISGDSAKNRAELLSRQTDMTYDDAVSAASIEKIRELWNARPGSIIVPGHDLPMVFDGGKGRYLIGREAAIKAWYGKDLKAITRFDLTETRA